MPWLLLAAFVATSVLGGPLYRAAFWAQALFYALAVTALAGGPGSRWRVATAAAGFVVLNAAAWLAFWVWSCGRAEGSWRKVAYDLSLPPD